MYFPQGQNAFFFYFRHLEAKIVGNPVFIISGCRNIAIPASFQPSSAPLYNFLHLPIAFFASKLSAIGGLSGRFNLHIYSHPCINPALPAKARSPSAGLAAPVKNRLLVRPSRQAGRALHGQAHCQPPAEGTPCQRGNIRRAKGGFAAFFLPFSQKRARKPGERPSPLRRVSPAPMAQMQFSFCRTGLRLWKAPGGGLPVPGAFPCRIRRPNCGTAFFPHVSCKFSANRFMAAPGSAGGIRWACSPSPA